MSSFLGTVDAGGKALQYLARNFASNPTSSLKKLGGVLALSNLSSSPSSSSDPSKYSSVSSSSSNSLSSLSSSTKPPESESLILNGSPFMEMVEKTDYKAMCNVIVDYDIYVVRKQLHWLLLVRMKSSELSFITLEITTTNLKDCIPTMRRLSRPTTSLSTTRLYGDRSVPLLTCEPETVGQYHGRFSDICRTADAVLENMEEYNLLTNNCQHFINNLLSKLGFKTYQTTVGPQTSVTLTQEEREFDLLSTLLKN